MNPNTVLNANKILGHLDKIENLKKNNIVYPIMIELDLSNQCPHNCPACTGGKNGSSAILDLELAKNIIDQISSFSKSIIFAGGGEPLMHPNFCEILEYSKNKGLELAVITNGSLLDEKKSRSILKTCSWIKISVDGGSKEVFQRHHGMEDIEFEKIWKNIENLSQIQKDEKSKTSIVTAFLIDKSSINDMRNCIIKSKYAKVDYLQFRPFHNNRIYILDEIQELQKEFDTENFKIIKSEHAYKAMLEKDWGKKRPYPKCLAQHFTTVIGADAKIYICCHHRREKKYELGDLNKENFKTIWKSPKRKDIFENIDYSQCPFTCRNDAMNRVLFEVMEADKNNHLNFI